MQLGQAVTGLFLQIAAAARAAGVPLFWAAAPRFAGEDIRTPFDVGQSIEDFETHGYRARDDLAPWPISPPVDWSANPFADDNWQFLFHGWGMTDPYFARYRERGEASDLAVAATYAADWARFHYEDGGEATYSWFDMAAGVRAMRTAILLDRIEIGELLVSSEVEGRLRRTAEDHVRRLQVESFVAPNNHGLVQMLGLRMLCALPSTAGREAGARFADRKFGEIIRSSYTRDGIHKEHSPYYAILVRSWLEWPLFRRFWDNAIEPRINKALPLEPWYIFPNGDIAAVGDSAGKALPPTMLKGEEVTLADGRRFAVKDLSAGGYAIVRTLPEVPPEASSMLFVTGAAYSLTHKHVDDLSFILFEGGRFIFIDTGTAGYTRDLRRRYVLGASAHNTISLADVHIEPRNVTIGGTKLSPIRHTDTGFLLRGTVERGTLFRQRRTIAYDPGRSLTIRDRLSGRHHRNYVSNLHLAPDLEPRINETRIHRRPRTGAYCEGAARGGGRDGIDRPRPRGSASRLGRSGRQARPDLRRPRALSGNGANRHLAYRLR